MFQNLSGYIPGGNFRGGNFQGEFDGWEFFGWEFSGESFPDTIISITSVVGFYVIAFQLRNLYSEQNFSII